MPQADPLNSIMGMLRKGSSIDPGALQARQARMSTDRRRMGPGASPVAQYNERPRQQMAGPRQVPQGAEVAGQGQELAQGQDMVPIMVDQMNEIILSGKIQIHKERDPERKRMLENQLENMRRQILDLGGEPIWANETIEEGLNKLRGMGAIAVPEINAELGLYGGLPQSYTSATGFSGATGYGGVAPAPANVPAPVVPSAPAASQIGMSQSYTGATGYGGVSQPAPATGGVPLVEQPNALGDVLQNIGIEKATGATGYAPPVDTGQFALDTDYSLPVPGAPLRVGGQLIEMPTMPDFGNYDAAMDSLRAAGLDPSMLPSAEDWEAYRVGLAQQSAMSKRQIVQRELDRFEGSFPNEFEKAKKQVAEWAGEQTSLTEENMASRGMYYSSIMANAVGEINEKSMEIIGDIAKEAALKVADLRAQLQDIDELEVLELEIARREARMEFVEQRMQLANMLAEVQYQRDVVALQRFQTETDRYMNLYNAETARVQAEFDRMIQNQQVTALGQWAMSDPFLRQQIESSGFGASFASMNPYLQASIVESFANVVLPLKQSEDRHKTEMAYLVAQTAAERARAQLLDVESAAKAVESEAAKSRDALFAKLYQGDITPDEIRRLVLGGDISGVPSVMETLNIADMLSAYMEEPERLNTEAGQLFVSTALQGLRDFAQYSPEAYAFREQVQDVIGNTEEALRIQRSVSGYVDATAEQTTSAWDQFKESLRQQANMLRRDIYYQATKDPAIEESIRASLLKQRMSSLGKAYPTQAEMVQWEKDWANMSEGDRRKSLLKQIGGNESDVDDVLRGVIQ